jgi:membrane protease YdiL (CAAX protease family)
MTSDAPRSNLPLAARTILSLGEVIAALLLVLFLSVALAGAGMLAYWSVETIFASGAGGPPERFASEEYLLSVRLPYAPGPETLLEIARRRELADGVELEERDGETWLVVFNAPRGAAPAFLEEHGYVITRSSLTTPSPMNELLDAVPDMSQGMLGYLLVVQGVVMLAVGWVLYKLRVRRSGPAGPIDGAPSRSAGMAVLLGGYFGLLGLFVTLALEKLQGWAGFPVQEQDWVTEVLRADFGTLALAPLLVLIVPVAEEVFFRGYAFSFLTREISPLAGYLVSSLLFAAAHLNPTATLIYVAYGLVLAYGYRTTGHLATPITAHAVINGFNMLMVFLLY